MGEQGGSATLHRAGHQLPQSSALRRFRSGYGPNLHTAFVRFPAHV